MRWEGQDIQQLKELYSGQLMYLGHLNGIKDDLTAVENLVEFDGAAGSPVRAWGEGGVRGDRPEAAGPSRASGLLPGPWRIDAWPGSRVHVDAPLWLLDEPFVARCGIATVVTQRLHAHLQREGLVVVVTHQEIALPTERQPLGWLDESLQYVGLDQWNHPAGPAAGHATLVRCRDVGLFPGDCREPVSFGSRARAGCLADHCPRCAVGREPFVDVSFVVSANVFTPDYLDGVLGTNGPGSPTVVAPGAGEGVGPLGDLRAPRCAAFTASGITVRPGGEALPVLVLSLLLGTPTLGMIGAIGAALVLGVRGVVYWLPSWCSHSTFQS